MKEKVIKIKVLYRPGIHARAAAKIVEIVSNHKSRLFIKKNEKEVEASNILSILTLDCPKGTELQLRAVGDDSEELLNNVSKMLEKGFDAIDEGK